jgi:hypothetical protein
MRISSSGAVPSWQPRPPVPSIPGPSPEREKGARARKWRGQGSPKATREAGSALTRSMGQAGWTTAVVVPLVNNGFGKLSP